MVDEPRGFNPDWNPPQEPGIDPIPLGDQAATPYHGVPEDSLPPPIKAGDGVGVFYDGYAYVISIDREDLYAYPWPDSVGWVQINDEVEAMIRDFSWTSLTGVPTTFPPSTHTHTIAQVTNLQTSLNAKGNLAGGNSWTNGQGLNGTAGSDRYWSFQTNLVRRWVMAGANSTAEAGANSGSDFRLERYADDGSFIAYPLTISRATGTMTLETRPMFGVNTPWDSGNTDNAVTNAKLRDSQPYSVIGRAGNSVGDPGDIIASANDTILRRVANTIAFGQLTAGMFPAAIVTNAMMANMGTATFKARATAGAGVPEDITPAQAKTLLAITVTDVGGLQAALDLKLNDAPSDGDTYGRKNGAWVKAAGAAQIQDAAPATGDVGTFWWSSLTGQLAIRYNDGNTTQWVGLNGSLSTAVTISDNAPASPYPGLLWWSSLTGELSIRYNDGDSEQWVSAFGGSADSRLDAPWVDFAGGISASSGVINDGSITGRYKKVGSTVHFVATIVITNNGTGAGGVRFNLPVVPLNSGVIFGRENAVAGKMLQGVVSAGSAIVNVYNYDNTYPGANGYQLRLQGTYEVAP